jgi:hypothetical protein
LLASELQAAKALAFLKIQGVPASWGYGHSIDNLEPFEFAADLFFGLAKPLLQTAEQLIFLALGERQVVLREFGILLL